MTVAARRFAAVPKRTSAETWEAITSTICAEDANATREFRAVAGIAAAMISEEALKEQPLVIEGGGVRVRVYCIYGEAALGDDDINEAFLAANPFAADGWRCHLPCEAGDLKWVSRKLETSSQRFLAYDLSVGLEEAAGKAQTVGGLRIDAEALKNL